MEIPEHFFIADDDLDDQELFIEALKEINHFCKCVTAVDGQEAIHRLTNGLLVLPDFIFLDLNMPKMNGKECLKQIKDNSVLKDVPVVIYTTSANKNEMEQTMQMGAACFLQKPNSYAELKKELQHIIFYNWK